MPQHSTRYIINYVHNRCCTIITISIANISGACTELSVRLFGGARETQGTVEVCVGGEWLTVCGWSFDVNDARVVCRQLGLSTVGMKKCVIFVKHYTPIINLLVILKVLILK